MSELQSTVASNTAGLGVAPLQSASLVERWYVLIMMCLVYTLSIADRYVVSTVLDPIRLELHLTDKGVALLTGAAFGLFYVVLGFPLSWLIDRKNRRNIVAACLVLWSIMTAVCGLARTSWEFFFARVGVTIGEAGGTPGANSLLSDYFPASRRAMALTAGAPCSLRSGSRECWPGSRCGSRCASRGADASTAATTVKHHRSPPRCASCGSSAPRCM